MGNKFIDKEMYSFEYFSKHNTFISFFNEKSIQSLFFNSEYSSNKCPLVFYNTKIMALNIERITSSYLSKNVLEFLLSLEIIGQINSIQDDLFKSFKQLKLIRFRTQNAKNIIKIIYIHNYSNQCFH